MDASNSQLTGWAIQRRVARAAGMAACIYGYPLVEMMRNCRLQTRCRFEPKQGGPAAIDTLHWSNSSPMDSSWSETPDQILYATAWLFLGEEARQVIVPCPRPRSAYPYLLSFYNAYGEHIVNINDDALREGCLVIRGPHTTPAHTCCAGHLIQSQTDLVWMLGRIAVNSDDHYGKRLFQSSMHIGGVQGSLNGRRPAAVELWEGDAIDAFVELAGNAKPAAELARLFFGNLCRSMAHTPVRPEDRGLIQDLRQLGLSPAPSIPWDSLDREVRAGLVDGFRDAGRAIDAVVAKGPYGWTLDLAQISCFRRDHMIRAAAARIGLGRSWISSSPQAPSCRRFETWSSPGRITHEGFCWQTLHEGPADAP